MNELEVRSMTQPISVADNLVLSMGSQTAQLDPAQALELSALIARQAFRAIAREEGACHILDDAPARPRRQRRAA